MTQQLHFRVFTQNNYKQDLKWHLQTHVQCSIIHNNHKVEGTLMSTDKEMNKEKVHSMKKH